MPSTNPTPDLSLCGRRTVLKAVGIVALAGGGAAILGACSPAETATPSAAPSDAAPSSAASSAPSSSAPTSASAAPSSSAAAPAGLTVAKADVPVGGGVIVEQKYVVTQPTSGEFKAFSAICTHQQNPVGEVVDKQIVCNFHQSHFSITDGSPISGPAQTALPAVKFTVSGNDIVLPE